MGPSHTHSVPNTGWSNDATNATSDQLVQHNAVGRMTAPNTSGASGTGAITGASASGDNVPAYVTVVVFQKD